MFPFIIPILMSSISSSAENIYNKISRFMGGGSWSNKFPKDDNGIFFGNFDNRYYGCTRTILIKVIEILQQTQGWLDASADERSRIFINLAAQISNETGASPDGLKMFMASCYVSAVGDSSIRNYFATPDAKYSYIDYVADTVSEKINAVTQDISERADLLVSSDTSTSFRINPIIKWALIGLAGFLIFKKITKP